MEFRPIPEWAAYFNRPLPMKLTRTHSNSPTFFNVLASLSLSPNEKGNVLAANKNIMLTLFFILLLQIVNLSNLTSPKFQICKWLQMLKSSVEQPVKKSSILTSVMISAYQVLLSVSVLMQNEYIFR